MSTLPAGPPGAQHGVRSIFTTDLGCVILCDCGWRSDYGREVNAAALHYDLHIGATAPDASQPSAGSPGEGKSSQASAPCSATDAARDLANSSRVPRVSPESRAAGLADECLSRIPSPESADVASEAAPASNERGRGCQ